MFALVSTIIATLGATGMGSILKVFAGAVDRWASAAEAREKREMLREMQNRELDIEFQKAVFGAGEGGAFSRGTRRIVAVIGMLNFAAISILCTIWPSAEIVTFTPPSSIGSWSLLWGIISFPKSAPMVVSITSGHLAITSLVTLGAIVGFYFTPGGRK